MLVTRCQPDDTPHWQLITDRLDGGANRVTMLDAASGAGGPGRREERQVAGDATRTWVLTPLERSVLGVMLQAHGSGMDWLGLTNVAIPAGLSLDETAAALAKPVQLGYVEQRGERGAIYQLTGEGRRIAASASMALEDLYQHQRATLAGAVSGGDANRIEQAVLDAVREWTENSGMWPDDWRRWEHALNEVLPPGQQVDLHDVVGAPKPTFDREAASADMRTAWDLGHLPAEEIPAAVAALPAPDVGEIRDVLGFQSPGPGIDFGPHTGIAYEACTRRLDAQDTQPAPEAAQTLTGVSFPASPAEAIRQATAPRQRRNQPPGRTPRPGNGLRT
jgi:hypothetical protein